MLDLSQNRAAAVIASISNDQMSLATPCDLWDVKDVINKLVASTRLFTGFGLRQQPDPSLDLINPKDLIGDDPVGVYLAAAKECRDAWRTPSFGWSSHFNYRGGESQSSVKCEDIRHHCTYMGYQSGV